MSPVADVNKDKESQRSAIFGHQNSTAVQQQSSRKVGPVAGWFDQKRFSPRVYNNNGGVPSTLSIPKMYQIF